MANKPWGCPPPMLTKQQCGLASAAPVASQCRLARTKQAISVSPPNPGLMLCAGGSHMTDSAAQHPTVSTASLCPIMPHRQHAPGDLLPGIAAEISPLRIISANIILVIVIAIMIMIMITTKLIIVVFSQRPVRSGNGRLREARTSRGLAPTTLSGHASVHDESGHVHFTSMAMTSSADRAGLAPLRVNRDRNGSHDPSMPVADEFLRNLHFIKPQSQQGDSTPCHIYIYVVERDAA